MGHSRKVEAFTRKELLVVIAVSVMIALLLLLGLPRHKKAWHRIACVCNLKQIGRAYRIWANDNGDHFPALRGTYEWRLERFPLPHECKRLRLDELHDNGQGIGVCNLLTLPCRRTEARHFFQQPSQYQHLLFRGCRC
jgi:hypothetical protein